MENLSLETAISQVENLFIIPRGNYKLYLDEELTQELDDQFITNYSQNSDSATVIKIFVKEIVTIEQSLKLEEQSLEAKVLEEFMDQELIRRFFRKNLDSLQLGKVQALKLENLTDEQIVEISDKILGLMQKN